jgi:hypothetical protein
VCKDDARIGGAERARRGHVIPLAQGKDVGAHDARKVHPGGGADDEDDDDDTAGQFPPEKVDGGEAFRLKKFCRR